MSKGITNCARVAVIAFVAAIVAGCTTWDLPESVRAELGIGEKGTEYSVTHVVDTEFGNPGDYFWCKTDAKNGSVPRCVSDGNSTLNAEQIAILRKWLNPAQEDDEAAESVPVPGQIDTAVPGGTPSTCGGIYNPC